MTDQSAPAKNAAGVPLVLHATVSGSGVSIDYSQVPEGIDGVVVSSSDLIRLSAAERQALMIRLYVKYDGVTVDEGGGSTAGSVGMEMTPADYETLSLLRTLGATTPATPSAPVQPATPTVVATSVPAPEPVAHTEAIVVHAIPEQPTPQQHASRWHSILSALEGLLAIGTSPEVMKLLPPKYQGIVAAAGVVGQVFDASASPPENAP